MSDAALEQKAKIDPTFRNRVFPPIWSPEMTKGPVVVAAGHICEHY